MAARVRAAPTIARLCVGVDLLEESWRGGAARWPARPTAARKRCRRAPATGSSGPGHTNSSSKSADPRASSPDNPCRFQVSGASPALREFVAVRKGSQLRRYVPPRDRYQQHWPSCKALLIRKCRPVLAWRALRVNALSLCLLYQVVATAPRACLSQRGQSCQQRRLAIAAGLNVCFTYACRNSPAGKGRWGGSERRSWRTVLLLVIAVFSFIGCAWPGASTQYAVRRAAWSQRDARR